MFLSWFTALGQKPDLVIQTGHSNEVRSVNFSPDGRILSSGSADNTVKLWDVTTGTELRTLRGHLKEVISVAFSPDGKTLVSSSIDSTIRFWEVSTGHELRSLNLRGTSNIASSLALSPDGKTLVSGGYGGEIRLWDVLTGFDQGTISGHTSEVNATSFSPDGRLLASASSDHTIKIWDLQSKRLVATLTGHTADVLSVTFDPSGKFLASAGADSSVKLWNVATRAQKTFSGHTDIVRAVRFSPDGRFLASGSRDESIKLWDVNAGTEVTSYKGTSTVLASLAFSPDEKTIASGNRDATIKLWDFKSGRLRTLKGHTQPVDAVAFSPDNRTFASVTSDNIIKLWDVRSSKELRNLKGTSKTRHSVNVVFSPDGKLLAGVSDDQTIKLWDVATGNEIRRLKGDVTDINSLAISPDGKVLASGGDDFTIKLWDVTTGIPMRTLRGHSDVILSVAFAPIGTILASASADNTIRLWNVNTGRLVSTFRTGESSMLAMAFNPAGTNLAVGLANGSVKLFDLIRRQEVESLKGHSRAVLALSFSPDNKVLATGSYDKTIKLWDVATGHELNSLTGHSGIITSVAFSRDSRILASSSRDGTTKLWEYAKGQELASLIAVDENDWLVITPNNLFDGSTAAWNQIYWRFSENLFDIASVEAFFNDFYYPRLLDDIFSGRQLPTISTVSDLDRRQPGISLSLANERVSGRYVTVRIDVREGPPERNRPKGSGAKDVRLFRNGSLVKIWRGDVLHGQSQATLETTIPIVAGENKFSAYGFNTDNIKSRDATLLVSGAEGLRRVGTFYILSVGINQYANPNFNLRFSVADSQDFATELRRQQERIGAYSSVKVITLNDREATKANIMIALRKFGEGALDLPADAPASLKDIKKAEPEDVVAIYLSGHGAVHKDSFYFVPHDIRYEGARSNLNQGALESLFNNAISDKELENALAQIDARHLLLILDTGNSGQALEAEDRRLTGPLNTKGLAQLAYEKGMYVLAAASANQMALESPRGGHGFLVYALIEEGLRQGAADYAPIDGQILLREWLDYAVKRIPILQGEIERKNHVSKIQGADRIPRRNVQRPRVFYPRELEIFPLVIAKTNRN